MGILINYIKKCEDNNEISKDDKNENRNDSGDGAEEDNDETKKSEGIRLIDIGPDGVPLKRNVSDVMNNFFINAVTRSFTNCEEILSKIN